LDKFIFANLKILLMRLKKSNTTNKTINLRGTMTMILTALSKI
jgi:hypothetical protein